jgi:predicted CXXCH cytochrome family protein
LENAIKSMSRLSIIGYLALALLPIRLAGQNTIVDLLEPAERRAFLALYDERDPLKRRSLAARFLQDYPRSFLTAQAHEAAAKSAADMGDRASALFHARQSLRLYPENPGLLVPLALWQRQPAPAAEALRLLNLFNSPAGRIRDDLRAAALALSPAPPAPANSPPDPLSSYAGSAVCANCHREVYDAWSRTGMANMLRPISKARILGDFNSAKGDGFRTGAAPAPFIELRRRNGEWDRYPLHFAIGSKWQQAYATRTPSGDLQVLPIQFNLLTREWLNYWRTIDPPGSERAEPADFHQFRRVTSYKENCAQCHTSQWRDNQFQEEGVNCEMCHGPSAAHARGEPTRFRFARATPEESVRVCAQCHAQSAQRTNAGFPPAYPRRPYVEFAPRAFYLDGRFRETTFLVEAFERSACYRKGGATCVSCHDPHPTDASSNPKSLKFNGSDKMCTQCHAASSFAAQSHTRHEPASEGARCVSCHMPKIMGALLFQAGSHQIDERPSADFTARFGQDGSPNACLLCHKDKNVSWLRDQLSSWPRRSAQ